MSSSRDLRLDWATFAAARYAVRNWHYSKSLPTGKLVKIGVWEGDEFKGVVLFSRGASPFLGKQFGDMPQNELCEPTRVALRDHVAPVSRIVAIALRMLRASNPGLRLVLSFADPYRGHTGGIYQAGNWLYLGKTNETIWLKVNGRMYHIRSAYPRFGTGDVERLRKDGIDPFAERIDMPGKYRYAYCFDEELRRQLATVALPYPKRPMPRTRGAGPNPERAVRVRPGRSKAIGGKK